MESIAKGTHIGTLIPAELDLKLGRITLFSQRPLQTNFSQGAFNADTQELLSTTFSNAVRTRT
jgi:hypothetical protein